MDSLLIVDGYNIIHAWSELSQISRELDLEAARDRLLHILANYSGASHVKVIVVFDAYQTDRKTSTSRKESGVEIVFTPKGMTADTYIEHLVENIDTRNYPVQVATSDAAEQSMVLGSGAIRLSARELQLRCREATQKQNEYLSRRETVKPHTLGNILSEEMISKLKKAISQEEE